LDGCQYETLKTTPSGAAAGYNVVVWDSLTDDTTTGFTFGNGAPNAPVPQVTIGQGFFFVNGSPSGTFTWTQILTNSP
jgi:hypothetical protein